jgi:hypothetical protein
VHYFNECVACVEANLFVFKPINLIKRGRIIVFVIQIFHYVESNVVRFLYTIRTWLLIMQFALGYRVIRTCLLIMQYRNHEKKSCVIHYT